MEQETRECLISLCLFFGVIFLFASLTFHIETIMLAIIYILKSSLLLFIIGMGLILTGVLIWYNS